MNTLESITFREAEPSDAKGIIPLVNQLGYAMSLDDVEENLIRIIQDDKHYMCVAVDENGVIVGYAHISEFKVAYCKYGAEFQELCVDKEYRGIGIGKELVEHIKIWAWENGCFDIIGRTNEIRKESHKFYKHIGFTIIKKQCVIHMDREE